jgi:hypothetical protein
MTPLGTSLKSSIALFVCALALLLMPSYPLLVLGSAGGAVAGFVLVYLVLERPEALRFSWLLSATLLIAYAGGTISTWVSSDSLNDFIIMTKQRPIEQLCATLALVYVCCSVSLLTGNMEGPILRTEKLQVTNDGFAILLSVISLALIAVAYFTGALGFQGVVADENTQRISALGAVASLISAPVLGLLGYVYGRHSGRNSVSRLYCLLLGATIFMSIVPSGRRQIVLAMAMAAIGYSLSGGLNQRTWAEKLATAVAGLSAAYALSAYFFAIRLSAWELGPNSAFLDQLSLAFQFLTSSSLEGRFSALLYENLRERTFVLGYLSDLVDATQSSAPLYGEALLFYLRLSIPSVLDPSKVDVLSFQQIENFAHPKLGLPVIDQANTVLTDGVTDFGWPGGLVYLLGITALLCASLWVFRKLDKPFTQLVTGLVLIHLALKPELTLSEYFVAVRNLLWLVPSVFALEHLWNSISTPGPAPQQPVIE